MKQKQSESMLSTFNSISSHNRGGGGRFLATFLASFLALASGTARAELLLYDGFATETDDQNRAAYSTAADKCKLQSNNAKSVAWTTGLSASNPWSDLSAAVYTFPNNGLSLPAAFTGGTGDPFTARGGSAGWQDSGSPGENRAKNRAIVSTMPTTGTLWYRCVMLMEQNAYNVFKTGTKYSGTGLSTAAAENSYDNGGTLASNGFRVYFVGNATDGQHVQLRVRVGSSYATLIESIAANTAYICILGIDYDTGKACAYAAPVADYNENFIWTATDLDASTITNSAIQTMYLDGPYQTGTGRVRFDEIAAGTKLSDVAVWSSATAPKLRDGSLSFANGTYTASALLTNSAANVSYVLSNGTTATTNSIAAYLNGDTASASFSAPADDTTYKVLLVAENQGGETGEISLGTIYGGTLSLTKVSDADEGGLAPATLTVSRVNDDPLPLVVNYSFADGTAVVGVNYVDDAGSVTIPAGQASATITVHPLVDVATDTDTTMIVSIAAGNYTTPAAGVAVSIANFTTPDGYNYWVGGTATDGAYLASTAANWSAGHAPLANENVVFDGNFSSVDCEWDSAASATVASWTQTNGYAGTVTFDTVYAAKGDFTVFTITGDAVLYSGAWSHPLSLSTTSSAANDAIQSGETYRLKVSVGGTLTVDSGASVNVVGKGVEQTAGSSPVARHGGTRASGTACYGNPKYPVDVGSAEWSGTDQDAKKAAGGGAVHLVAGTAVVVNGTILADGEAKSYACGAGGSILIEAPSVTGSGTIRAGYTYATGNANSVLTGAGGRVALITTTAVDLATLSVSAAAYATGGNKGSGGAGTVYLHDASMNHGVLIIDNPKETTSKDGNPRTLVTSEGDWTFDEVRLGGWCNFALSGGNALHLPNGLASVTALSDATATASSIYIIDGTLDTGSATAQTMSGKWQLSVYTNLVVSGDLTLTGGAMLGRYARALTIANSVDIATYDTYVCDITVTGDLTVDAASSLSVLMSGFGQDASAYYAGYGTGSHGGCYGDTATLASGSMAYGSILDPLLPARFQSNSYYQPGGGVLKLTVGGTLTLNGQIDADGYKGGNSGVRGAGGSINVTAGALAGSGAIHADGYSAESGGRVAVRLANSGATFDDFKGTITARRDGAAKTAPGTVYLQTAANGEGCGTIIVDGSLRSGTASSVATPYTPIPANGAHADDPADLKKCSLEVSNYARIGIAETLKLASLETDSSSVIDLNGKTLTVKSAKVNGVRLAPGTYAAGSDVEIGEGTLADYLVDTADGAGGELIVGGVGLSILVR